MNVTFITGNQHKADYLARLLGIEIAHQKLDLDEIQSTDLGKIVEHKVRQAYDTIKQPVLVEDVSLGFTALHGLPGPFIKFFVEQLGGLETLCRMLDGLDDRTATAHCMFGYFDGKNIKYIRGEMSGYITDHPRGERGFGWDKIFCPDGYGGRTRAELSEQEYDELYKIIRPMASLKSYLESRVN